MLLVWVFKLFPSGEVRVMVKSFGQEISAMTGCGRLADSTIAGPVQSSFGRIRIMTRNLGVVAALVLAFVVALVRISYAGDQGTPVSGMCTFPQSIGITGTFCCQLISLAPDQCFLLTDVTLANNFPP